jgi:hypothetical protein
VFDSEMGRGWVQPTTYYSFRFDHPPKIDGVSSVFFHPSPVGTPSEDGRTS